MKGSRTFAGALIATYLMGGGLGVPCVLCFSTAGHFSLEAGAEACGSCCAPPAAPAPCPAAEHGGGWENDPCPSCIDIPLSTACGFSASGPRPASEGPPQPRDAGATSAFELRPPLAAILRSAPADQPAPGILDQLRTVILRR